MNFKTECVCCGAEIEASQETFDKGTYGEPLCDTCEVTQINND